MSTKSPCWFCLAIVLSLAAVLTACGGGQSSGAGADAVQTAGGGIGGTGISFGSITKFGSIFVNGVEFSTAGATIVKDDAGIDEQQLRLGMTVEVRGSIDDDVSGTAAEIRVEEAVRGPVESVGPGTLVVLGQTVIVDDTTLFENNVPNISSIHVGDLLEVHGLPRSAGTIGATFIVRTTPDATFVVRGFVASHDAAAQTFKVGALTVNYAGAAIDDLPTPSGSNWNGLFVEVKGSSCSASNPCGTLNASLVESEGLSVADADEAEVEGFVTAVASPTQFTVGNQTVVTNASTAFIGGVASDIGVGVKLEVEGRLVAGVITATEISFRDDVRLEADTASVDAGGGTITLTGLAGVSVSTNAQTQFAGGITDLSGIGAGDHLRISGRPGSAPGAVIATEVELRSADNRVVLQGPPTDAVNPNITILGVVIDTTGVELRDVNDISISPTAFFSTLSSPGDHLVKARGIFSAGAVVWDQVELED